MFIASNYSNAAGGNGGGIAVRLMNGSGLPLSSVDCGMRLLCAGSLLYITTASKTYTVHDHITCMGLDFLISAIIVLLVVGLLCWCVQRIPGLPEPIPVVIQILIVLAFALWLLNHAGILR